MTEPVTAIFFSCRRLNLLKRTFDAFMKINTYPIFEYIIVNDSGNVAIHEQLKREYPDVTLVLNKENVGLMKSIDLGYSHVRTNYFFHSEDDWMMTEDGAIKQSLAIMLSHPEIEEVWLQPILNKHPTDPQIYESDGVQYRLASEDVYKGFEGYDEGWHGFTTACSLKRMNDYLRVAPYANIKYTGSWKSATIWHREYAIGLEYHKLGYRTAVLLDKNYAVNIGIGQSEYKTGNEK